MSDLDLDAIRARADAATPGPWTVDKIGDIVAPIVPTTRYGTDHERVVAGSDYRAIPEESDAEFIAHAREDVPALVAEVDRLRKIVSDVRYVLSWEPADCPVRPEDDDLMPGVSCGWRLDILQIRSLLDAAGYVLDWHSSAPGGTR